MSLVANISGTIHLHANGTRKVGRDSKRRKEKTLGQGLSFIINKTSFGFLPKNFDRLPLNKLKDNILVLLLKNNHSNTV